MVVQFSLGFVLLRCFCYSTRIDLWCVFNFLVGLMFHEMLCFSKELNQQGLDIFFLIQLGSNHCNKFLGQFNTPVSGIIPIVCLKGVSPNGDMFIVVIHQLGEGGISASQ